MHLFCYTNYIRKDEYRFSIPCQAFGAIQLTTSTHRLNFIRSLPNIFVLYSCSFQALSFISSSVLTMPCIFNNIIFIQPQTIFIQYPSYRQKVAHKKKDGTPPLIHVMVNTKSTSGVCSSAKENVLRDLSMCAA